MCRSLCLNLSPAIGSFLFVCKDSSPASPRTLPILVPRANPGPQAPRGPGGDVGWWLPALQILPNTPGLRCHGGRGADGEERPSSHVFVQLLCPVYQTPGAPSSCQGAAAPPLPHPLRSRSGVSALSPPQRNLPSALQPHLSPVPTTFLFHLVLCSETVLHLGAVPPLRFPGVSSCV